MHAMRARRLAQQGAADPLAVTDLTQRDRTVCVHANEYLFTVTTGECVLPVLLCDGVQSRGTGARRR